MKTFLTILRVLITLAAIGYSLVLITEALPPYDPATRELDLRIAMIAILFTWFLAGYYYLWKNERTAGILLSLWWVALFFTAWLVWDYGNVTVVLGFPVFILGLLLLVYWRKKKA